MFLATILSLAALVTPVYTNHNAVAGYIPTMTNMQAWASSVSNAVSDTSYAMTNEIVALNQSVQYVVANGATKTILPPAQGTGVRDWIVYINATEETPLNLSNIPHILCADEAYTNAVASNVVTAIYFSEVTNNVFVIGRQELTPVK